MITINNRSVSIDYKIVQVGPENPRKGKHDPAIVAYTEHKTHLTPGGARNWLRQLQAYSEGKTTNALEVSIHDATSNLVFMDDFANVLVADYKAENLPKGVTSQHIMIEASVSDLLNELEKTDKAFANQPKPTWFSMSPNVKFQLMA